MSVLKESVLNVKRSSFSGYILTLLCNRAYVWYYWGPKMLTEFSGKEGMDYDFFMILHVTAIMASLFASTVIDYGRRKVLFVNLLVLAVAFVAVQHAPTIFTWKLGFLLVEGCVNFSWTVGSILSAELFPTAVRARAYGTLQVLLDSTSEVEG